MIAAFLVLTLASPAAAEVLRIATWNSDLSREGPGLLARDIARGDDPQVLAALQVIAALDADVLLLTSVDYDRGMVALGLLQDRLAQMGRPYPHLFALRPNTGMQSGLDLDADGRLGEPEDAQGWGRFAGEAGMAILSRLPVEAGVRDFSAFLWADLPGNLIPPGTAREVRTAQRLSTTGHWDVTVATASGPLHLLAFHATPPVFDGAEDWNGRRNYDEALFWTRLLDGALPIEPPPAPFVLLGDANLDPVDGDGLTAGISALLSHPAVQDPRPRGNHGRTEPTQKGDPALDTALYDFGGLRVDYVLPSAGLTVTGAGLLWPAADDPFAETLAKASRHAPVWVEVELP